MLVFGHRGASGYLPENTLEAFALAFDLGADAIEFDVVITKDSVPIIRHDDDLTVTTDAQGKLGSVLVSESTWPQIQQLRATERYANRVDSKANDGKFSIPSLAQLLNDQRFSGKRLILEIKFGKELKKIGLDPVPRIAKVLESSSWKNLGMELTIESFDFDTLLAARETFGKDFSYFFLSSPESLPKGKPNLDLELIKEVAANFDGLSVAVSMLFDSDVIKICRELKLPLYAYTARTETAPEGDWKSWFQKLGATGIDGIFADQPDLMIQMVRARA